jgi:hypothetical protein
MYGVMISPGTDAMNTIFIWYFACLDPDQLIITEFA